MKSAGEASALEARLKGALSISRSSLKNLYQASSSAGSKDSGPTDSTLQHYMKVKSDTRALLTYYRDVASRAPGRPAISITNNTVSVAPADKSRTAAAASSSSSRPSGGAAADDVLVEFEASFDLRDEGGLPLEQQRGVSEASLLRRISDMNAIKDNTLYKLVNASLAQLDLDHIVSEPRLPPNLEACSKELPMIFHFLRTFKSLGKKAKLSDMMNSQADAAAEASRMQIQIEQLTLDVQARLAEIFDLRKRLDVAALQTERQNTIVRQQDRIASLEKALEEQTQTAARIYEDFRREVQGRSQSKDQVALVQSRLENVKAAYDRDITCLQPVLEELVQRSQADVLEMQSLRNDATLGVARLARAEQRAANAEGQQAALQATIGALQAQVQQGAQAIRALEEEAARQARLKVVLTAAKVRYHELALAMERRAEQADEQSREMHGHCVAYASAVSSLQEYVRDLEDALRRSEEENADLQDTLKLSNVDLRGFDLQAAKLRADLDKVERAGAGTELQEVKQELTEARAESERKSKQLATALLRVYELQGQLLDAQGDFGDAAASL